MVMWDETTNIDPYRFSNPAGLSYLPSGTRLGMNLPWFNVSNSNNSYNRTFYGISPQSLPSLFNQSAGFQYQGFIEVTKDKWAFQEIGSYYSDQFPQDTNLQENFAQKQALVRIARDFGALSIGTEFQYTGNDETLSGSEAATINRAGSDLNTGALLNLQLGENQNPIWLRIGGSVALNVANPQYTGTFVNSPTFSENILEVVSTVNVSPCLFLDIPEKFQAGFVMNTNSQSVTTSDTILSGSIPSQSPYLWNSSSFLILTGVYRWRIPLSQANDPKPLTFNNGVLVGISSSAVTGYNTNETVSQISDLNTTSCQAGIGLEKKDDFTFGLQMYVNSGGTTIQTSPGTHEPNISLFQLSLGGEKWVVPHWAARMGLTYEDDQNTSNGFYSVSSGQEFTGLMTSFGAGYYENGVQLDSMIYFERPSQTGTASSTNSYSIFGAELSVNIFLN